MATEKNPTIKVEQDGTALQRQVESMLDRVRQRAFEIFQSRGSSGNDFEDWLRAESETFVRPTVEFLETADGYRLEFAVPGLEPGDLDVRVSSGRVVVKGERTIRRASEQERVLVSEYCAKHVFRELAIPLDADPLQANARLEKGILVLTLPRAKGAMARGGKPIPGPATVTDTKVRPAAEALATKEVPAKDVKEVKEGKGLSLRNTLGFSKKSSGGKTPPRPRKKS